jgi:hypothetical protein
MSLPSFTDEGLLPPGDYLLTVEELRQSYLVTGEGVRSDTWDVLWRGRLVDNTDPNSAKRQLPMWHQYRVEFYPHFPGLLSGIRDQFGYELPFPSAFRLARAAYRPKGIIRIARPHEDKSVLRGVQDDSE